MTYSFTFKTFCIALAGAALSACGGGGETNSAAAPSAAPSELDASRPSAITVLDNMSVGALAGQTIGSACKVMTRQTAAQTVNLMIGAAPEADTRVEAGTHAAFFNAAGEFMFGFGAIQPINVATVSATKFRANCGN